MMECTRCGSRNPDGAEFCANPACRAYLGFDGKRVATLPGGVTLQISVSSLRVDPGKEVVAELRIRNRSDVVDGYALSAVPGWVTVEPQTVSLFPDKEQTVLVRFRPPREPGTPAGQTSFTLTAVSKSSPAVSAQQSGAVEVGIYGEMAVQMTPQISHAKPTATHRVAVENRGNTPLQVALEGTDPEEALSFEIDPSILRVEPGKTELAQMQVQARQAPAKGPAQQHGFHLAVRPDVGSVAPATVDGYTVVEPIAHQRRAPWFVLLAPIAALLLVATLQLPRLLASSRPAVPLATSRIPDASNLLAVDAARLLGTAGFAIDQAHEPSDTTAEGRVIRTDPAANREAPKHSVVRIVVSSGKPAVVVPHPPAVAPPKSVPKVAIFINEITLINSEHTVGDVFLAVRANLQLPDGTIRTDVFKWNRGGGRLNERTTYRVEQAVGNYPAGSRISIVAYTDSDDGNRWPSLGHAENYQGEVQFGPLNDASRQGLLQGVSRNDQQHPGFRVAVMVLPLPS
jgi:hypothetical protein